MKKFLLAVFFVLIGYPAFAQIYPTQYRPPELNWQQLITTHFRIVYPSGGDSAAYSTARILESQYGSVKELVGGNLERFPVVLNTYNDRSNGFVTALHFRSEIMTPPFVGKTMNPQTGSWLETVAPHELVHALHFSRTDGLIANFIKLFSPDAARSIHGAIPSGMTEGIATYHESVGITDSGGRGNNPFFSNQFDAVFQSDRRWSMGQIAAFPDFTRPFDRHYIGGYTFTSWLHNTYGDDTTGEAIEFHNRWPFLGYGVALKHATGHWPGTLYEQFTANISSEPAAEYGDNRADYHPLAIPYGGRLIRRPKWLSGEKLIFFGSFYNARPGFFSYDLETGQLDRLTETNITRDYQYTFSDQKDKVWYSYYNPDPIYDQAFKTEIYELDMNRGKIGQHTRGYRVHSPETIDGSLYAIQNEVSTNRVVRLDRGNDAPQVVAELPHTEFVNIKVDPADPSRVAVVANRRGVQGIWITSLYEIQQAVTEPPLLSFSNGSLFDPDWHPSGNRLLFTSDHSGTMNIFEYDLDSETVIQLTRSRFNAFEASYSPDGNRIAFIQQVKNEQLPFLLDREDFAGIEIPASLWSVDPIRRRQLQRPVLGHHLRQESEEWQSGPYSSGLSWLKPRLFAPIGEEVSSSNSYQVGLNMQSNDLLQRNAYSLDLSLFEERLWYDLSYRHSGFYPGFLLEASSDPSIRPLQFQIQPDSSVVQNMLQQRRTFSAGLPFRFVLEQNSRFSSLSFIPSLEWTGFRFFDLNDERNPVSDFGNILSGNLFMVLNHNLQQNIRDLQPNAGIVLFSEVEHFFTTDNLTIQTLGSRFNLGINQSTGFRAGIFTYFSPLRKWNQSLRVGLQGFTQDGFVFDPEDLVSNLFESTPFPRAENMLSLSTRYTIPLWYPDNGGLLVPLYLSNLYLVAFSNTVSDLNQNGLNGSVSVFGAGLRARFRLSNLTLDLGIAIGYEPSRSQYNVFVGDF